MTLTLKLVFFCFCSNFSVDRGLTVDDVSCSVLFSKVTNKATSMHYLAPCKLVYVQVLCGHCGKSADEGIISCSFCPKKFHLTCMNMTDKDLLKYTKWSCPACAQDGKEPVFSKEYPTLKKGDK